ncbi:MAG: tRNA (adenosine(37)-N6)-dimethylallyltransferase MiaA [Lachnospiraceae bacterium]|nr:tRNA (adenosine(37)-N6)-dimethylallyltransferase MiaA [Lachnospiraceae bacterium]
MYKEKPPLVILTGPTAVGKTGLSIALAKAIGGEIISADSMQVYRGMDIGTAKIKPEEMQGVRHHLIDVCDPTEDYNVARFCEEAGKILSEIYERGHVPIIVGGTGFYIQALLYQVDFSEQDTGGAVRQKYQQILEENGARYLHELLRDVDPASAEAIHPNNVKRVMRALEFYELSGTKISDHNEEEHAKEAAYHFAYFVLTMNREMLYERINARVDQMFADGLIEEVKGLLSKGIPRSAVSMQGLGYKETVAALLGEMSFDEAREIIKRDTRHFAKRQMTWFRRERDVIWLSKDEYQTEEALLSQILKILREEEVI